MVGLLYKGYIFIIKIMAYILYVSFNFNCK